jgi:ubiquinone/menaquinone biosynthesis C-methylase UbiE
MPTLEINKSVWDGVYDWSNAGEEWSEVWGTSYMQWYGTLLPRIRSFLPAETILEIAPGFGRWTEFIKGCCTNLILVDLSEKCINACRDRFADSAHISYFVNDGKSLEMIPENSIDFIFSFDSLVHAEDTIISGYIAQLPRILKPNGAAFIHHSNLGQFPTDLKIQRGLSKFPKLLDFLIKQGILDDIRCQWRASSMSSIKMQEYVEENELQCISQELVNWNTRHTLIDCISTIVKKGSIWSRECKVLKNAFFMKEARNLSNLSQLYDLRSRR